MLGYASCREDLALGDEMHGRLETGDVGYVDADGFLYLTGRTKRFAKIAGLRLGLDQMEKEFVSAATVACVDGGDKILVYYDDAAENILKERVRAIAVEYKIPVGFLRAEAGRGDPAHDGRKDQLRSVEGERRCLTN